MNFDHNNMRAMGREHLTELISRGTIERKIHELARRLNTHYGEEPVVAVCVLKGAFLFFSDLVRQLTPPPAIDFVRVACYGNNTSPSKKICLLKDVETDLRDQHVLVVEDIVDTGRTLALLLEEFSSRNPKSLKVCALMDKKERREVELAVDFPGFELEKGFVVGYGMDFSERYRCLDAIHELRFEPGD